jgi:hypothetical protein
VQPPTDGPRSDYTAAQVRYLIENSSSFDTDMGLEVIDLNLNVIDADAGAYMSAATIRRSNYADIHASADFTFSAAMGWGRDIVRPFMTFTGPTSPGSGLSTMKFYQGAYFLDTPDEDLSESPPTIDATGYDILSILDDPIGDDYAIDIGESYLARVEEILLARGVTKYHIDQDAYDRLAISPMTYTLEDNPTWLQVVNDCCAAVGYQGIWTDWNGAFQVRDYTSPALRAPEWTLTADMENTLLTQRRKRSRDFYSAPNRWVFYQSSSTETQPVDGNGRFEYINQTVGDTSVEARGRVITAPPVGKEVPFHGVLVAVARLQIDRDMLIPTKWSIDTAPLPLAWHMDRYRVTDPTIGTARDVIGMSWSLNLDGSDMTHEWSEV